MSQEGLFAGNVEPVQLEEEIQRSYLDYAMSVIVSRALPEVRDGLKPVHRRMLWSMLEGGLRPDRPHRKSAWAVGEVVKKYHPHALEAVYDALVRLAQDWSLRHPLIDPHGNFGSVDGDPPAAMRYTEARLAPIALELLRDIDAETVDFVPNYDGYEQQPVVLPSRFPNLLVNGSGGIAVGMATNIPPHNLAEVIDAVIHFIDNPEATVAELRKFVKGPDFPTGGIVLGKDGIRDAYETGRGSIKVRGVCSIEEGSAGRSRIVIRELPYQVNKARLAEKVADLVKSGRIKDIADVQDHSSGREGMRLVIDLKRSANPHVVLNQLYKHTQLQDNFGVIMLALVDGVPRTLNLAEMIGYYVDHQIDVVTRRTRYEKRKAEERDHIVQGLLIALDHLDEVIKIIRGSQDSEEARTKLMQKFKLSEVQTNHILDMPLRRLTRLARAELEQEHKDLLARIKYLDSLLKSPRKLRGVIKSELGEIRQKFAGPRLSEVTFDPGEIDLEDLIDDEELVITMTKAGYVKSTSAGAFRTQGRGGRGVQGARLKEEDLVTRIIHTTAHAYLLFFSNRGKVYRLKAHEIPMKERTAKGTAIVNLLPLAPDERIQAIIDTRTYETERHLFFATRLGQVKKTLMSEYDKSRREGFIAINLNDNDELVRVIQTSGDDDIFMVSRNGIAIRFSEDDVRPMGRSAAGVRGMRMREGDEVVSCDVARDDASILIVTDAGYGKRTQLEKFNRQGRGGQGVRGIKLTARRGYVVAAFMVGLDDEIFGISTGGTTIRVPVREISSQGRDATGVRVMNLDEGQSVAAVAPILAADDTD